MVEPITISLAIAAARQAFSMYQQNEAKNSGLTPEQLKKRIEGAHNLIKSNFQIIERLDVELQAQGESFNKRITELEAEVAKGKTTQTSLRVLLGLQAIVLIGLALLSAYLLGAK